ncbi:MAG: N-6 DNA methylase [Desulfobaccales bacterium]
MDFALTPVEFCEKQAYSFILKSSQKERKAHGQFFTPAPVARFMANFAEYQKDTLKVLDPGAGVGILSCAICEVAAKRKTVKKIEIDAYEIDPSLNVLLRESFNFAKNWIFKSGIELSYNIIEEDFILDSQRSLWKEQMAKYDLAISNPPYFKIGKNDPRALSASKYVFGQPNIYSLFMGITAESLRDKGIMVVITPRSYAAGPYFKLFRKCFFKIVSPVKIHIFQSRKETFKNDEVLQENIILKAKKYSKISNIKISISKGMEDLDKSITYTFPTSIVLYQINNDIILRLPNNNQDIDLINTVEQWTGSLHKYGMEISTGPVVPFRAKNLISNIQKDDNDFAPLIWLQNVLPMSIKWPCFNLRNCKEKPQFLKINSISLKRRLLILDQNLVILRRFSAKEEHRRLTASPLLKGQLGSKFIGVENHLNYIYKPKGELSETETLGLAALFNSSMLDRYFRVSSGNTQVSATEIRAMPLPSIRKISAIGFNIKFINYVPSASEIDELVWSIITKEEKPNNLVAEVSDG